MLGLVPESFEPSPSWVPVSPSAIRGRMNGYALTLKSTGEASRALGNEQAACEQFSRARDLYRKLGYSQSNSSPVFAQMEKDCGHLRAAMSSGGPVVLLRRVDKPAAARHSLLGPYDLHRYPDLQVL